MIGLGSVIRHRTFTEWVESLSREDIETIVRGGYDGWENAPEWASIRKIYFIYKKEIWQVLKSHAGEDVCGTVFGEWGYMANTEDEFINVLVGCAIEIIAGGL